MVYRILTAKTKKMKKYFIKSTGEEIIFGDEIELDFIGKEKGRKKHCHLECKFIPELLDALVEGDIIEEREVQDIIEFGNSYELEEALDELYESQESLEKRVETLEKTIEVLTKGKSKK